MAAKTPAKPGAAKAKPAKPAAKKAPAKKPAAKKTATKAETPETTVVETAKVDEIDYTSFGLQPMEALFVDHYIANNFNATRAYRDAGYTAKNDNVAAVEGSKALRKPKIAAYLRHRMKEAFDRIEEEQDKLLMTMTLVAYGDPNELIEHRRECCRYCYGEGHRYQFTPREFEDYEAEFEQKLVEFKAEHPDAPLPEIDPKGGTGFDPRKLPHEDCPECFGEGRERTVMKDTRFLSPAAQAMYAGVKQTKDGFEMLMHSQEKARETLAKIRKLYDDKAEVVIGVVPQEKLDAMYADALATAEKGREEARQRREKRQEGGK